MPALDIPTKHPTKHSYAIKPVPKPVSPLQDTIRPLHNLTLEKVDTAAIFTFSRHDLGKTTYMLQTVFP